MWRIYEAAKNATANASEYVSTVQEKAQHIVTSVSDEASQLLHSLGNPRVGPVDDILYEEVDAYKRFTERFSLDPYTDQTEKILADDEECKALFAHFVPQHLTEEEFWCRYFFRLEQAAFAASNSHSTCQDCIDRAQTHELQIESARESGIEQATRDSRVLIESMRESYEEQLIESRQKIEELYQTMQKMREEHDEALRSLRDEFDKERIELKDRSREGASDSDLELWKSRAVHMKKAKDQVQLELTALQAKFAEEEEKWKLMYASNANGQNQTQAPREDGRDWGEW